MADTDRLRHDAHEIIAKLLIAELQGVDPVAAGAMAYDSKQWPVYSGHMPDGPDVPACALAVFTTVGTIEQRELDTGFSPYHPGIQIRVRSNIETTGFRKASKLREFMAAVEDEPVTSLSSNYLVESCTPTSHVLSDGSEPENRKYNHFINFLVTLTNTSPPDNMFGPEFGPEFA